MTTANRKLDEGQRSRVLRAIRDYLEDNQAIEESRELDAQRVELIEGELGTLVGEFVDAKIRLPEFKSAIDSINKRNEHWGFKGIKGQMFFNLVFNTAENAQECEDEIRSAILVPGSDEEARSRLENFNSYVRGIRDDFTRLGKDRRGAPNPSSIPFFLSYFWQVQNWQDCPVYYTNSVQEMTNLNLWQPTGELADDYLGYRSVHDELRGLFHREFNDEVTLYDVEHVFWHEGGPQSPFQADPVQPEPGENEPKIVRIDDNQLLSDSYVPPIVATLSRLAIHDPEIAELAKRNEISVERAFEKNVNAAFTILGFDTTSLGQGAGRVPDGRADASDEGYSIIWDAKVRSDRYSIGTDDRAIREYITKQNRQLRRRGGFRNIYFAIVSGRFADDYDETVRAIKMETDVNEVVLLTADALIAMVDAKLREPNQITLGPDGLQRFFATSGVVTASEVRQQFI